VSQERESYGGYFLVEDRSTADAEKRVGYEAACRTQAELIDTKMPLDWSTYKILVMEHCAQWDPETGEFLGYFDSVGWKAKLR